MNTMPLANYELHHDRKEYPLQAARLVSESPNKDWHAGVLADNSGPIIVWRGFVSSGPVVIGLAHVARHQRLLEKRHSLPAQPGGVGQSAGQSAHRRLGCAEQFPRHPNHLA